MWEGDILAVITDLVDSMPVLLKSIQLCLQDFTCLDNTTAFQQFDRIIKDFLWDKMRTRINMKKMWSPRDIGGMANVRLYNLSFEMSRLAEHWKGTDTGLSWIKIEQERVSPYKPLDVLSHGSATNGHDYSNPLLTHSKAVWR